MKFTLSFCLSVLTFSLCYSGVAGFNNPLQNEVLSDNIRSLNLKVANAIRSTQNSVKALSSKPMKDMKMFSKIRSVKLMEESSAECNDAKGNLNTNLVALQGCMDGAGDGTFDFESGDLDSILNTICDTCKAKMDAVVGAFDSQLSQCPAEAQFDLTESGLAGFADMFGMICVKCSNTETYLFSKIKELGDLDFEKVSEILLEELCNGVCAAEIQSMVSTVTAGDECDIGSYLPELFCLQHEGTFCYREAGNLDLSHAGLADDVAVAEAADNLANWCENPCAGIFMAGAVDVFEDLTQCSADENGSEMDGENTQDVVFLLTNMCAHDDDNKDYCLSMAIKDTQADSSLREMAECASPPSNDTVLEDRTCEPECKNAVQAYLTDAGCCAIIEDMFLHPHNFHHRRGFASDRCKLEIPEICASKVASGATSLSYAGSLMVAVIMSAALW